MRNIKITTNTLAKICNVSQGTVDRALNNRTGISILTKQKILDVAKQYGYREQFEDDSGEIVGHVGIIVFNLNNEYFSNLITIIEDALKKKRLGTIVMMSRYNKQYEIDCIRNLYNMGVEGIVLCSVNSGADFENYLKLFDIPIVTVGNRVESIPFVGIDDFLAMHDITEKVLNSDSERIIYFSPAINYPDAYGQDMRYKGGLSAMGDREYTIATDLDDIKVYYESKTTVICSNDYYALQVYFKSENVKITGVDNIQTINEYHLPIDTVGYDMTEIAKGVCDIIEGKKSGDIIIKHRIYEHNNLQHSD